jgi:hypothetical protein
VQINFTERGADLAAAIDRVRSALLDCCGDTIEMIEGQGLRRAVLLIFDETFAITTVLLLIALVVAALGIATTLAVLVLQRRRQLNTIRAVGGSAAQLRRMIVWEASLIVLVGQAAGLACGFHPVDPADLRGQPAVLRLDLSLPGRLVVFAHGPAADFHCRPAGRPAGGQAGLEHLAGHAAAGRNPLIVPAS